MAWRVVCIEKPAKLSLRDEQLVIGQENEIVLPCEDIDTLIIDSPQVFLSMNIINKLAENNVNVLCCDDRHLPMAQILQTSNHSRQAKNSLLQIKMKEPLRKQIWARNIRQKIENQAFVLKKYEFRHEDLLDLARGVKSGDAGNSEGVAARLYFDRLLGDRTRQEPIWFNSALNYGYALIRGCLARSIVTYGFIPQYGIFHHNELNNFNLADDFIEAFRPFVDDSVMQHRNKSIDVYGDSRLTRSDREFLLGILNENIIIGDRRASIKFACELMVESFLIAAKNEDYEDFIMPRFEWGRKA